MNPGPRRAGAPQPLATKDLIRAAKIRQPTTKGWFRTARSYIRAANEDGLYDDRERYLDL